MPAGIPSQKASNVNRWKTFPYHDVLSVSPCFRQCSSEEYLFGRPPEERSISPSTGISVSPCQLFDKVLHKYATYRKLPQRARIAQPLNLVQFPSPVYGTATIFSSSVVPDCQVVSTRMTFPSRLQTLRRTHVRNRTQILPNRPPCTPSPTRLGLTVPPLRRMSPRSYVRRWLDAGCRPALFHRHVRKDQDQEPTWGMVV